MDLYGWLPVYGRNVWRISDDIIIEVTRQQDLKWDLCVKKIWFNMIIFNSYDVIHFNYIFNIVNKFYNICLLIISVKICSNLGTMLNILSSKAFSTSRSQWT